MTSLIPTYELEASQITLDVRPKALREIAPSWPLSGLDRRLDETDLRPAFDPPDPGIPQSRQNPPACRIAGAGCCARPVLKKATDDGLINSLGLDLDAGAEPHQRH